MKQGLFKIRENVRVSEMFFKMVLEGDCSAMQRAGQFVDIMLEGCFLRRPFAAQEWTGGSMTVIYRPIGEGTARMTGLKPGTVLDVLTGLGNGFDASSCRNKALVVCGGLGASPAFSLVKDLIARGKKACVVLGFNKAGDIVLEDEYNDIGADVRIATLDGSAGTKGLVTDVIRGLEPDYDYFYTCGPKVMMKAVCEMLDCPGEASLEERMGCGCGICYGCTCHTAEGPRRICADGPVFKKENIIW